MSDPLVTVARSVFNAAATVGLAVRSILAQTCGDWELIVIDDGSTDRTREILSRAQDPRIRFIQEPSGNLGLAPRLNQCVRLARGRYIARMDADDVAYPQRLEKQVSFLQDHPDIDLLGTGAVVFKGEGEVSAAIRPLASMRVFVGVLGGGFRSPIQPGWGNGCGLCRIPIVKGTRGARTKSFFCEVSPIADLLLWKRCYWAIAWMGFQPGSLGRAA